MEIGKEVHRAFDGGIQEYGFGAEGNIAVIDVRIDVHQATSVIKKKNHITQKFVEFKRKKKGIP